MVVLAAAATTTTHVTVWAGGGFSLGRVETFAKGLCRNNSTTVQTGGELHTILIDMTTLSGDPRRVVVVWCLGSLFRARQKFLDIDFTALPRCVCYAKSLGTLHLT